MPLENILKCNKVKVLTQDKAKLAEAIKTSPQLELNPEGTSVCRKGNPPVPELNKTGKRKEKDEDDKENADYVKEQDLNDP